MDYRINSRIRVPEVRLVGTDGEQLGVVSTRDALRRAEEADLDLVEVAPQAKPPVCKMLDYGKFKYEQEKKAKEDAKKQRANRVETKEIQLRPVTDQNDLEVKLKRAEGFLNDGNKVKFVVKFRGREMAHKDQGISMMKDVISKLSCQVEYEPKDQGRSILTVVAPKKT